MDIKIRCGFRHPSQSGTAILAVLVSFTCFFFTSRISGIYDGCARIHLSRDSSNITLPPRPPYWPSHLYTSLYQSVIRNGTETAESCMSPRERHVCHVSTMGILLPQILAISKFVTFTGHARRLFILGTVLLWTSIVSLAIALLLRHDCYHQPIVMVFFLLLAIVFGVALRADGKFRNCRRINGNPNHIPNGH